MYVSNNPVNWIDPEGLLAAQIVGAILGGGLNAYNNYSAFNSGPMSGTDFARSQK